jgi:hypothetical protein
LPFTKAFLNYFLLEKKTPKKKEKEKKISFFTYRSFKNNFTFTLKKPPKNNL